MAALNVADAPRAPSDRLLGARAASLAEHRRNCPAPPRPQRHAQPSIVDEIARAGLLGRGGGAFPTARKLHSVAHHRGRPVVVVNGAEGEPASGKDAFLLRSAPHLVLDGAEFAAAAVGAQEIVVAFDRSRADVSRALVRTIAERAGETAVSWSLAALPSQYVAGEEHALVAWVNGGLAKPVPGRIYESGVDGRPTLVDNVETLAHVAQIGTFGADWFRALGTADEPGTILCTVSGAVARHSVVEVPIGASLATVVHAAGGATREPQAVLLGGYYGAWLPHDSLASARLSNAALRPHGVRLGCGAIVVLGADGCGIVESARILAWLASQSAGQCGPCVHGLAAIADEMQRLATGHADRAALARLERWAGQIEGRGACSFPDGAVRFLRSALRVFAADAAAHAARRPCGRPATLGVPAARASDEWR